MTWTPFQGACNLLSISSVRVNFILWLLSLATLLALPLTSGAQTRVPVLVIDSAADVDRMLPFLDMAAMTQVLVRDDRSNLQFNLLSWNRDTLAQIENEFGMHRLQAELNFMNQSDETSATHSLLRKVYEIATPWRKNRRIERSIAAIDYAHGTFVSNLALEGLSPDQIKLTVLAKSAADNVLQVFERVLAFQPYRIVNLSGGWDIDALKEEGLSNEKAFFSALAFQKRMKDLVRKYPETIFVLAAGNDGKDISDELHLHSANLKEPNVIVAGASDYQGVRWESSNFSNEITTVFAPGKNVMGRQPKSTRPLIASGTSISAPLVTNRLIKILSAHPQFTAKEAIHELLQTHTVSYGEPVSIRFLIPEGAVGLSPQQVREIIPKLTEATYRKFDRCKALVESTFARRTP